MKITVKFVDQPMGFKPENNCYIRALNTHHDVMFSDNPDFVFYSAFGTDFLKYPNSIRIFLCNDPVLPNFNDCDYAIGPANLSFGERYFRQPPFVGFGEELFWQQISDREEVAEVDYFNRAFCNFIYSNATIGDGAHVRIDFCRKLSHYKHVDCPGRVLNNMSGVIEPRYYSKNNYTDQNLNSNWSSSKLAFLQNYKFTIAFENVSFQGWTTEKLIHPLLARSVPIYWGNPNVAEYFNPKAFINCADYDNDFDEVVRVVTELDRDKDRYMEMLRQPFLQDTFPFSWENDLATYLDKIVKKGKQPYPKNPIGFATMGAKDLASLCREGKMGMRKILDTTRQCISGWIDYKLHRHRQEEIR